jgi:hypothetical protein
VVIAYHAASATASYQVVLKASPLCQLSTLGLLMISMITLYSSLPGHEILLILNSGGVVMFMRFSKSFSLLVGIGASFSKSFDLVSVVEHLVFLDVALRSVVFIIFTFILVAFFFFLLIVLFLFLVMVMVLRHRLIFLRVFPCRYCDHNRERFILVRRVALRFLLRQHIPRC